MKAHHSPTPAEIVQRFKFNRSDIKRRLWQILLQNFGELAQFCNNGKTLNDMLRDRMVCGVRDEHIQRCLFAKGNLTLQKVLEISQSME